jgi:RecA-family ATPase
MEGERMTGDAFPDKDLIELPPYFTRAAREYREEQARNGRHAAKPRRPAQLAISAAALKDMEFPPVHYIVDGYIAEGLTIFAGKPKIGKSWLCLDIACAVASGGVAFGTIPVEPGEVLYAALEDNPRRLQRRMQRVLPYGREWPARLTFWTECPSLDNGGLEAIRNWIRRAENPRLVVIDVFARVRPAKRNNDPQYDADYRAVSGLHELASDTGVAIVVVSHVRKMEAEDPLDTVSGTLGFTGAADSVLVLSSTAQGKVLYGRGRDIEEIEMR